MKKLLLAVFCLLIISAPLFAQMSKSELQEMYLAYLKSQNIKAEIDEDGDIEFEYELPTYDPMYFYIIVNERDQNYFQIMVPNIYPLNTEQKKRHAPIAAAFATRYADTVKVYINTSGSNVTASGEVFIASPEDFKFVIKKMLLQFEDAFDKFLEQMK